jgi:ABC-type branched-subunit amino acid transport system ATPase component
VFVRPPSRTESKRYRKRLRDPNWADSAVEELITDAVVYPDRQAFQGMLEKQGLLCEGISAIPEVAEMLGLQDSADVLSANLSHGDQKLLDIALALALEPSLLLLDEPTAGMGPEERWRMIEKVQRLWQLQNLTLVFIEHDMDIVFSIASSIRVLCYGRVLAEGTPDEIRNNPAVIEAYLGSSDVSEESK